MFSFSLLFRTSAAKLNLAPAASSASAETFPSPGATFCCLEGRSFPFLARSHSHDAVAKHRSFDWDRGLLRHTVYAFFGAAPCNQQIIKPRCSKSAQDMIIYCQGAGAATSEPPSKDISEDPVNHEVSRSSLEVDGACGLSETGMEKPGFDIATSSNNGSQWPMPLSPLAGEDARKIELERAFVAEAAMNAGPAFSRKDVLYEDEWLLIVNKPSGIYAGHVLATVPSILTTPGTLTDTPAAQPHLHLANRLDRDTSGVMVVTKCKKAAGKFTGLFERRQVQKTYIALCIGPRPLWDDVVVETGHGRSRWGAWRVYAREDVGRGLPEKAVVRDMATQFSVLSVNGEQVSRCCFTEDEHPQRIVASRGQSYCSAPPSGDEVLIRARPSTGRTHQIRLHCQFLGLPLRGDVKYGGPLVWKGITYKTHALHAESMSFRHPITAEAMHFVAPLPAWAVESNGQLIDQ